MNPGIKKAADQAKKDLNLPDGKEELVFELNLDRNGRPCIRFKHYDKSNSLEQRVLRTFLDAVKEKGCVLVNPNGFSEVGTSNSWEYYEIQIA